MSTVRRVSLLFALAGMFAVAGLGDAPAQTKTKTAPKPADSATPPTLTFSVYKDNGGKYRWRLKDASGTLLAIPTKGYDSKADCQKIVNAIIAGAAKAKVEDGK